MTSSYSQNTAAAYDSFAAFYDVIFADQRQDYAYWRQRLAGRGSTLEVGCGTGRISRLGPRDGSLVGLDVSRDMLAVARERLGPGTPLVLGDARALPLASGTFQQVICPRGVFSHILSPADHVVAKKELFRVAGTGSQVIVDVPNLVPLYGQVREEMQVILPVKTVRTRTSTYTLRDSVTMGQRERCVTFRHNVVRKMHDKGSVRTYDISLDTYVHTEQSLCGLFDTDGFRLSDLTYDYSGEARDGVRPRFLVAARKIDSLMVQPSG